MRVFVTHASRQTDLLITVHHTSSRGEVKMNSGLSRLCRPTYV